MARMVLAVLVLLAVSLSVSFARSPSPPHYPPPPPLDNCAKNGTGYYINGTGSCVPCPVGCGNGGFCNVDTGLCVCPLDKQGNPITSGPSDGCSTCQPNRDPRTLCTTFLDLCNEYIISVYNTTASKSIYNVTANMTSVNYCAKQKPLGKLTCQTDLASVPTKVQCSCPTGGKLVKGHCVDINECHAPHLGDPCYFTGTDVGYFVEQKDINTTTGKPVINETTGKPVYIPIEYYAIPAYGATCVNLVWSFRNPNVTYNCTCPPCYYPTLVDEGGVVRTCDPFPNCELTQPVVFDKLFRIMGNGTALNEKGKPIMVTYNATPAV
jgi:hypothetical protein